MSGQDPGMFMKCCCPVCAVFDSEPWNHEALLKAFCFGCCFTVFCWQPQARPIIVMQPQQQQHFLPPSGVQVQCPNCRTLLHVPMGAPHFQCSCGQVLAAPVPTQPVVVQNLVPTAIQPYNDPSAMADPPVDSSTTMLDPPMDYQMKR